MQLYATMDDMKAKKAVAQLSLHNSSVLISDAIPPSLHGKQWYGALSCKWTAPITGPYEFGVIVCGRAKLYVDQQQVVDNWTIVQKRGDAFFGQGTTEVKGVTNVKAGQTYQIRCEYSNVAGEVHLEEGDDAQPIHNFGVRLGGYPIYDEDKLMEEAVQLAKQVDAVVLAVGLGPEFESEGFDRPSLDLSMRTNELVERVAAANSRTIVAVQSVSRKIVGF